MPYVRTANIQAEELSVRALWCVGGCSFLYHLPSSFSRSHLGWFLMFVKCLLLLQNSNPRIEVDKDLGVVRLKSYVWKTLVQDPSPGPGLCPAMTRDTGTHLCPFRWSCLFVPSPCTGVRHWTVIRLLHETHHRVKGKSSLSFCAIPRAKSLKPHKRATPFQFQVSHTFHLLSHAAARLSLCRVSELKYSSPKHIWNRSALLNKHV